MKKFALLLLLISTFFAIKSSAQKTVSPATQPNKSGVLVPASKSQALLNDNSGKSADSLNMIQRINSQFAGLSQSIELLFAKLQNENRNSVTQLNNAIAALNHANDSLNRKLQQPANINTEKEGPKGTTPNATHGQVNQQSAQQINQQIASNNQQKINYQNQIKDLDNEYQQSNSEKQKLNAEIQSQKKKLLDENMKAANPNSLNNVLQNMINSLQQTSSQVIQNLK